LTGIKWMNGIKTIIYIPNFRRKRSFDQLVLAFGFLSPVSLLSLLNQGL